MDMSEAKMVDGVHMHLEDKKISRNFFWMLWILYAVVYMTKSCYSAAMASIVNDGVLTKSQTGLINAVFYAVYAPMTLIGGMCCDKYNSERLIKIGLVGSGISNLVIFFNQNYYVMLAMAIFNGMAQFAVWPSVFKIASSQLEPGYRVKSVYYIALATPAGLILSYLVAAFVPKWQYNFLISAVALFLFACILHVATACVEPYMVPDTSPRMNKIEVRENVKEISTAKLLLFSGFLCVALANALRIIVSNSVKTLSATLLMETYEFVSPTIGNMLNIIVILMGIVGTYLVNKFVYPRLIRNEVVAFFVLGCIVIIPVIVMSFIGKIPLILFLISLSMISLILTGGELLVSWCYVAFAKYGKNGAATGLSTALNGVGFMLQNYVVVAVADGAGWKAVVYLWMTILVIASLLVGIAIPLWNRFKNNKI